MSEERGLRKTRIGVVISDKMDKTCVIQIKTRVRHPLYGKIMNRTSKLKVHDEKNECGIGDTIRVMETRPLSHALEALARFQNHAKRKFHRFSLLFTEPET